jgi:cell wall-associated NlpC family hydrolase
LKPEKPKGSRFLKLLTFYLLAIFVVSAFVAYRQALGTNKTAREVCSFARQFLSEQPMEDMGKQLDCSGFTRTVYKKFGYTIPRTSAEQFKRYAVVKNKLKPGDLVFFSTDEKPIGHVGIYLKNNTFIHSPGNGEAVRIDDLTDANWRKCYQGSGTVIVEKEKEKDKKKKEKENTKD